MDHKVLVLNANYEPINVCNLQRALGLMMLSKADLILNGRGVLHTSSAVFPIPSVIRLSHMVHAPRPKVRLTRREILRRDHDICQYCGCSSNSLTIDHVIPRRLNGKKEWTNVVAACPACNHKKGSLSLQEAGMKLLRLPKEPPQSAAYIFSRYLPENAEWEPFLNGW